jgi:Glycosyl transferase family 2
VRLVVTLRTRDQADLADANVAFHLAAGADFVIATDHRSVDDTRSLLTDYERTGRLRLICQDGEDYTPGQWVNDMARLALLEHDADWVIHADADEFWWPHGGTLKDVIGLVPDRYGVLLCPWRHFAPRPDDDRHFCERMTLRVASHADWTRPEDPFHPNVNVAHRAHPAVRIRPGNHDLESPFEVLRGWFPIEVLHFPLRSSAQARSKVRAWSAHRRALGGIAPHVEEAGTALFDEAFDSYYGRYVVDHEASEDGTTHGIYAVDTRLRDALRILAGDARRPVAAQPAFHTRPIPPPLSFPALTTTEAAVLAADASVLPDPLTRASRRVERLETRLALAGRGSSATLHR